VIRRAGFFTAGLVTVAACLVVAPAPIRADDQDDNPGATISGEYIVEVDHPRLVTKLNARIGGTNDPEPLFPGARIFLLTAPASNTARTMEVIRNVSGVVHVQPNVGGTLAEFTGGKRYAWADVRPADPTLPASAYTVTQDGLGNAGLPVGPLPVAAQPVVAVLDTGIDRKHPALAGRIHPGGTDIVDGDADPSEVADGIDNGGEGLVDEAYGHGTYVAGIIALVAPEAQILPIRVLDSDGDSNAWLIARGLVEARARGAEIINMSLGAGNLGRILEQLVKDATEDGIVIVASAGNDGDESRRWPAAYPEVISVAAYDGRTGTRADFTNRGSWVQLAAPGVDIDSTYPGGRYARWGGTSASAPVVAGAAALIRQVAPRMPPDDVAGLLYSYARQGKPFDFTGHGGLNVAAALVIALEKAADFGGRHPAA
jgi:subtilisin family serine protease